MANCLTAADQPAPSDTSRANAALIASAPALYEALADLVAVNTGQPVRDEESRQALADAHDEALRAARVALTAATGAGQGEAR